MIKIFKPPIHIIEEYYSEAILKYQTCDVLLIDDLFKGKVSDSDINIMFEIINYRYLNFLPIIVSSEFYIERLLAFDEAIGSRIYDMAKDYAVEIEKDRNNNSKGNKGFTWNKQWRSH